MMHKSTQKISPIEELDSVHNVFQDNLEFAYKNTYHSPCKNEGKFCLNLKNVSMSVQILRKRKTI